MKAPECPVYRPTLEEVQSQTFVQYVESLERKAAFREAGICKIVAPDGYKPRRRGYEGIDMVLPRCGRGRGRRLLQPGCRAAVCTRMRATAGQGWPHSYNLCAWPALASAHTLSASNRLPRPAPHRTARRRPIRQHATGRQGLYRTLLVEGKKLTLAEFQEAACEAVNAPPKDASVEDLERKFWCNVTLNPPLYGGFSAADLGFKPALHCPMQSRDVLRLGAVARTSPM